MPRSPAGLLALTIILIWPAAQLIAQPQDAAPPRTLGIFSGLAEGRGSALAELLATLLPETLNRPVILKSLPAGGGVVAASRLSQAGPDGSALGLLPVEAAITRALTLASPYASDEIGGRLVIFEEPFALIARHDAPYDDLSALAAASASLPVVLGHGGLERQALSTLQILAMFKSAGISYKTKLVLNLEPGRLTAAAAGEDDAAIDVMAWPLSEVQGLEDAGSKVKILALLVDDYEGPCAPDGLSLSDQGRKLPIRNLVALYEPSGPQGGESELNMESAAAVLASDEARVLMAADCLKAVDLDLAASPGVLSGELEAQAALLRDLAPVLED